jgi:hypothetical protein
MNAMTYSICRHGQALLLFGCVSSVFWAAVQPNQLNLIQKENRQYSWSHRGLTSCRHPAIEQITSNVLNKFIGQP